MKTEREKETMIRTTQLKGNQLRDRLKKLSQPLTESVSMVEPTKYHNRVSPTSRILQTFHKQNDSIEDLEDEDDEIDLQELIDELNSEMEDEIDLDEILEEMGYYDEEDEDLDELRNVNVSRGYEEGRKLVDNLRRKLFRTLNDEELDDFMDVISRSFDMNRR
ncbi:hypothetical protein AAON49_10070 [Pseudotenacibaculum sp. MALMAid0570]|uniref:hypothetical protein n=1 Tax=Pseudotenacibaculum sp. MALMAid0570 TaxID=3143938 RepID=UPI0032DE75D3